MATSHCDFNYCYYANVSFFFFWILPVERVVNIFRNFFYLFANRFYVYSRGKGQETVQQILPSGRRTPELRIRDTLTVEQKKIISFRPGSVEEL